MAKDKQQSILAAVPDERVLPRFVELLNTEEYWGASLIKDGQKLGGDYRPIRAELRRLVQAWSASGPNVCRLFDANPGLSQAAQEFRPHFIPTKSGNARLAYLAPPEYSSHAEPVEIATELFLPFLLNPFNKKVGACRECEKYFLKNTRRRFAYCSQECGSKHTSKAAIRKKRESEYAEKLKNAKQFLAQWSRSRDRSKNWKQWVSKRSLISTNWLTRAVKKGELAEPIKHHLK